MTNSSYRLIFVKIRAKYKRIFSICPSTRPHSFRTASEPCGWLALPHHQDLALQASLGLVEGSWPLEVSCLKSEIINTIIFSTTSLSFALCVASGMQCCCTLYQIELRFALVCLRTAAFLWPMARGCFDLPPCLRCSTLLLPLMHHIQIMTVPMLNSAQDQDPSNNSYNQSIKTSTPQVATNLIKYIIFVPMLGWEETTTDLVNRTYLNSRPT